MGTDRHVASGGDHPQPSPFTSTTSATLPRRLEVAGLEAIVCAPQSKMARAPAERIRDHVLDAVSRWSGDRRDHDLTLMVLRHVGIAGARTADVA